MILTPTQLPFKKKSHVVGDAPFSGFFYTGFYFVPLYALEQMYYGVSDSSRYFSFKFLIRLNNLDVKRKHIKDFYPVPNLHFSKKFFHNFFLPFLQGKKKFFFFKPNTFFYDFFLGLLFFVIWQLGGGFRLSPLLDTQKKINVFGFYDLRFTPLSTIFKFIFKINFFFGFSRDSILFSDYYYFNTRSLTRGFLAPYNVHEKKNWGVMSDPITFFFLPLFFFLPELVFTTIFHFFFRPFFYFYFSFVGKLISKYENKISLFDHFWIQLYAYYLDDVCSLLRLTNVKVFYSSRLIYISTVSSFFYFQSVIFSKYWKRRFYRFFSFYGISEFIFSERFSKNLYKILESEKISVYKNKVFLDSFNKPNFTNNYFIPEPGFFYQLHFQSLLSFKPSKKFWNYFSVSNLKKIPIFSQFSPYVNKVYINRFSSSIHVIVQFLKKANNPTNKSSYAWIFRNYKFKSRWFIYHFTSYWPYRFYYFLSFKKLLRETVYYFVQFFFNVIAPIWMLVRSFSIFNKMVCYKNKFYKPYKRFIFTTKLSSFNRFFHFLGYFFFRCFGFSGLNFYEKSLIFFFQLLKFFAKAIYSVFYTTFHFLYSWYSYFFWLFFRPILTIFYYFYLELRFFFIFYLEYFKYYQVFYSKYYYYNILKSYYLIFQKFFIGSKFFRFFTREVGEDLEESVYNNDQDLESDSEVLDYIFDFPAYEDFQSNSNFFDQGYFDFDELGFLENNHYFDFWHHTSISSDSDLPAKPNIEFFAENYYEQENDLTFQLFCIWTSPVLFDFLDFNTSSPVYEYKDSYDANNLAGPGDWYPLELTQMVDYEEDHLEYYLDSGTDELEISETESINIIPFDSQRAKLSKFSKFYQKKLAIWHSYQVKNNFQKLPEALKYLPIPASTLPFNFEQWQKSTKALSTVFFTPQEIKSFKFKFETFNDLDLVWSRVDYELERNPKKFYDFLSNTKNSFIFDDFFSEKKSSKNLFYSFYTIFKSTSFTESNSNFVRYLHNYFSGYADLSSFQTNTFYRSRNPFTNVFIINYFYYLANNNNKDFIRKFWLLSSFSHFSEFRSAFEFFVKHRDSSYFFDSSKEKFLEEIYFAQANLHHNSQNFSPVPAKDYWNENDGMFLWMLPRKIRPDFSKWRSWFRISRSKTFYKKKKRKKKKKINKNDLVKVFFEWCRHEQKILYWRYSGRGNKDHYGQKKYTTSSKLRSAAFENIFSSFIFDSFSSIRYRISKVREVFMFREYRPGSIFYYYTDGEDDSVIIKERQFSNTYHKRRSYFSIPHIMQGSVWQTLNPIVEDFFYETYYINNNFFFPSGFSDHFYSDFFNDDVRDSGLDIYDEYIFIGGVKDFSRNLGEGAEDLVPSPDEYGDEDTDDVGFSDETTWKSDEYVDFDSAADDGIAYGHETDGENSLHYVERFWFNSDWFFYSEHADSDEGLEEWEPDEFDSFYDVDHSLDRFFFGALRRENHFPATDHRIFLGTFWEKGNIDKDLDYKNNFNSAKLNVESKALIPRSAIFDPKFTKKYFSKTRFFTLSLYRLFLYLIYGFKNALIFFFFSNFDNPKYFKLLNLRAHYVKWYTEYSAFYVYKTRLIDWIAFFEKFEDKSVFLNYKSINKKILISEPQALNFLDDPYGRFWFQYPFTNHLQSFSYYSSVNLLETDYLYEDLDFSSYQGKAYLDPEKKIDTYQTDITGAEPGSDLSGMDALQEASTYKDSVRFFSSDPTRNSVFFRSFYSTKLDKITSFPWFADRTRLDTVGSDFTYLDFIFLEDVPEDDEFIDEDPGEDSIFYSPGTSLYNKWFEKNRYGSLKGPYIPNDGLLDGFSLEETDWDAGSLSSFSSDDFNTHLEDFSEIYDIYSAAISDWFDVIFDYTRFYFTSKLRKFFFIPFRYASVQINSEWLKIASVYGIWVLIFRNFINFSFFFIFLIYGFFSISRLTYYFFGEFFPLGTFNFFVFIFFFSYVVMLLRFFFTPVNTFYKSISLEEKLAFYSSFIIFFYLFNLNGYVRNPTYYAIAGRGGGSSSNKLFISNNFSPDTRRIATDWYLNSGFKHRPELNRQGWLFYKLAPLRPRYFPQTQGKKDFVEIVNPDRQIYPYNYGFASYPTYFNPYNIWHFLKFHVFNIVNDNVVGYTQFDRNAERTNTRSNVQYAHIILHRPELINWLHITSEESEVSAKEEILEQGLSAIRTNTLYVYYGVAKDRKKFHNIEFVNPINQARIWTPYTPRTHPQSFLPYDFRPKRITDNYNGHLFKVNSVVQANYFNTEINISFKKVGYIPEFIRRDKHTYKNVIDAEGTFDETIRSRKYRRSTYFSFGKKRFFKKDPTLYDLAAKNNWIYKKLFKKSFVYNYSDNFRKYIFYFNPTKANTLRDAYGLSFKDLIPYSEFLGHGKNKMFVGHTHDFFSFLQKPQKEEFFKILELELIESAAHLINHFTYLPKSGYKNSFYFDPENSSRFKLDYSFYDRYAVLYNRFLEIRKEAAVSKKLPQFPDTFQFYAKISNPLDNINLSFRNFISSLRLENLDRLTTFFNDYQNFKISELSNINSNSDFESLQYRTKVAQTNRIRRFKVLSGYFKAVKAANKQSQSDFFRDSINFINPYKVNSFYTYSAFSGHKAGTVKKTVHFEDKVLDPFFSRKNKFFQYRSSRDDRLAIYNSDFEYINPVFDQEKKFNRRVRRNRINYERETRYSFGYYEYWDLEPTLWNIFLDFIMVRDLFENAGSIEGITFENTFDYKFNDSSSNRGAIKIFQNLRKNSAVRINTLIEKKSNKITPLEDYFAEQSSIVNSLVGSDWESEYDDEQFVEVLPRYKYTEKMAGISKPYLKSDRFNFRTSDFFSKKRFYHWLEVSKESPIYERHRKPYFGMSTRDETEFYFSKKFKPARFDEFPYLITNHVLSSYIWFSTMQRSRILYDKTSIKKNFPYNQQFIELFEKSKGYVGNYIDFVSAPLTISDWKKLNPQFAPRLPVNSFSNEISFKHVPKILDKKKIFGDNPDISYEKKLSARALRENMIANRRLALFKTFIKDKKSFKEFNEETKKFSFYFRNLQKGFDVRGKQDILEQEDSGRYKDNFYHGLVRSDEEKGVVDILFLRARRRKELFSDESKKI